MTQQLIEAYEEYIELLAEENERLRTALIMIADKDKGPLYSVNAEAGTSKQVGWAYGTAGQLAKRALGE